ncbi:MAG: TIM barrel protein [Bacteroidota bacterium]
MAVSRRNFIASASATSAGILLHPLQNWALPQRTFLLPADFSLQILATNWGFDGSYDAFAAKAKAAGYDGVEVWIPGDEKSRGEFLEAMTKHGLRFGFLGGGWEEDFTAHLKRFEGMLKDGVACKPLYFNCHSGRDWFTHEQAKQFFDLSYDIAKSSGVPVYHETHRGRLCFAAHVTKRFLEEMPNLRLTLDISHWCNVHESLLGDQAAAVDLALSRTDHIHARIGHAEGPQVNDPRAPEWQDAVKAHFDWWDKVVQRKATEGKTLTMLTEFGPPHYLPALPYTQQPVANQWDINVHIMKTLRERYK